MTNVSADFPQLSADSAAVLSELIVLRQRDGITVRKLQQSCPAILLLRATEHERNRIGLPPSDRHVAASQMLKCAVQLLIKRTDLNRILSWTLNIEGKEGGLEQRRVSARSELFLQPNAYARLEADAFEELAAALVLARVSPCGESKDDPITLELTITASAEDLSAVLNLLSLERRDVIRHALAQSGLRFLPRALNELESFFDAPYESSIVLLKTLVDAVLRQDWRVTSPAKASGESFYAASMQRLIFGQADPASVAKDEEDQHRDEVLFVNGVATERFFGLFRRNLDRLANMMQFVESLDLWADYLRGTASGDRTPESLPTLS